MGLWAIKYSDEHQEVVGGRRSSRSAAARWRGSRSASRVITEGFGERHRPRPRAAGRGIPPTRSRTGRADTPVILTRRGARAGLLAVDLVVSRRLRIAQVSPLYERVPPALYGGTERIVGYLTEELVKRGHRRDALRERRLADGGQARGPGAPRSAPRCSPPGRPGLSTCWSWPASSSTPREFDIIHCHIRPPRISVLASGRSVQPPHAARAPRPSRHVSDLPPFP